MTIVVYGYGTDLDATYSIVAYGLTIDPVLDLEAMGKATIEQAFVQDFSGARRQMSTAEFMRWKHVLKMMRDGRMETSRIRRRHDRMEIRLKWALLRK